MELGKDENKERVNEEVEEVVENSEDEIKGVETVEDNTDTEDVGDTFTPNDAVDKAEGEDVNGKMLTQSEVNEIASRARREGRESALKELLSRYGVSTQEEMDDFFGKGQSYQDLESDYATRNAEYSDLLAENALLKSGIDQERWDDVKLILKGKGLEVNVNSIAEQLPSHPEWISAASREEAMPAEPLTKEFLEKVSVNPQQEKSFEKPSVLRKLGNEVTPEVVETDEDRAKKLFGFN